MKMRCPLLAVLLAIACNDAPAPGPQPRAGDPELVHTWTMPKESSALASGDLGSTPPTVAAALMEGGTMPSVSHRITQHCAKTDALRDVDTIVLRFAFDAAGSLGAVEADPANAAGACMADALRGESGALSNIPAGAALLRVRLHPR